MVRRFENLVELGEESCRRFASRPLFGTKHAAGWKWTTYGELQQQVDALRGGLARLGVRPGDRVALVSNNRVEWGALAYATFGLGAYLVPMYEAQRPDEWRFILADCGAKVVFGSAESIVRSLEAMRGDLPALTHVVGIERPREDPSSYQALIDEGARSHVPSRDPDGCALAAFVYTSGTTGRPKGVLLTHDNLTSNIAATLSVFPIESDDRSLSFLPWAHAYGQVCELYMLMACGASTAFNTDPTKLIEELAEVRPTLLVAVPRIFTKLHAAVLREMTDRPRIVRALFTRAVEAAWRKNHGEKPSAAQAFELALADRAIFAKIRAKLGGRVRYAITASAALARPVAELIDALGIPVYEGYGLTETSPVVAANYPGARRMGSVGKPLPGVTVTIDTSVGGEPGRGEILVHGPNVMKGYHGRPEETASALLPDGGLRTGDLGYLDDDGYLYVSGRVKEQYKLDNGKYVMPSALEDALKLSPYVTNVMVHGANRPFNVALVVLDAEAVRAWGREHDVHLDEDLTSDATVVELITNEIARCGASLPDYARPREFVLTITDFTVANRMLTPTLKLRRAAVLERFGAALERLYGDSSGTRAA